MRGRSLLLAGILAIAPLTAGCPADDADPCPLVNDAADDLKTFQDDKTLFPIQAEQALESMKSHLEEAAGKAGDSGNLRDAIDAAIQSIDSYLPLYQANHNASDASLRSAFGDVQSLCATSHSIVDP